MQKNNPIYISHRGNIVERNINDENKPETILFCISKNLNVEVDVWMINEEFFLGHDEPQYKINFDFLKNQNLWCHAKNKEALYTMLKEKTIKCFWHQKDDYTITSNGFIWTYPGARLLQNSIAVMPEITNYSVDDLRQCYAICSDVPMHYKDILS
jgi:hypothetical protein